MPWWVRRTKSISARRFVAWWAREREWRQSQCCGVGGVSDGFEEAAARLWLWVEGWMVSGIMRVMETPETLLDGLPQRVVLSFPD